MENNSRKYDKINMKVDISNIVCFTYQGGMCWPARIFIIDIIVILVMKSHILCTLVCRRSNSCELSEPLRARSSQFYIERTENEPFILPLSFKHDNNSNFQFSGFLFIIISRFYSNKQSELSYININ